MILVTQELFGLHPDMRTVKRYRRRFDTMIPESVQRNIYWACEMLSTKAFGDRPLEFRVTINEIGKPSGRRRVIRVIQQPRGGIDYQNNETEGENAC